METGEPTMDDPTPAEDPSARTPKGLASRPGVLFLATVVSIFLAETLIMILLDALPPLPAYQKALCDSLMLSAIVFPTLYFLVFRPLHEQIRHRRTAEQEKEKVIAELQQALGEIKTLRGIIPICSGCKKVRDDQGYWRMVEVYVRDRSEAEFSHGLCPECVAKYFPKPDEA
jgi:hypothetical protein